MFIACKCLNIVIGDENVSISDVKIDKLGLSVEEQRDPFFKEKLGLLCTNNVHYSDTSFLEVRNVGPWSVYQCFVCKTVSHAVLSSQPHQILINLNLITTKEEVEMLRQSDYFSPVFNILLNKHDGMVEKSLLGNNHPAAGYLNRKLARALEVQMDAVEEAVRLFKERKYAEFEVFRDRAHRDHEVISSILNKSDKIDGISLTYNINRNTVPLSRDSSALSAQLANKIGQTTDSVFSNTMTNKPSRNNSGASKNSMNLDCFKEDSLDSEGIFDLEGTDPPHNGLNSDVYDSDSDDSVSRDEGIHIKRDTTQTWNSSIAKSLPVNVPAFTQFHDMSQERLDRHGDEPQDIQDIAASIKALARSVHGDVFGDLPRPRFSTQI